MSNHYNRSHRQLFLRLLSVAADVDVEDVVDDDDDVVDDDEDVVGDDEAAVDALSHGFSPEAEGGPAEEDRQPRE